MWHSDKQGTSKYETELNYYSEDLKDYDCVNKLYKLKPNTSLRWKHSKIVFVLPIIAFKFMDFSANSCFKNSHVWDLAHINGTFKGCGDSNFDITG